MLQNERSASALVDVLKDLIKAEIDKTDTAVLCQVVSVNADGSVNLYVQDDDTTPIRNIPNNTSMELHPDDYVYVFKAHNQFSTSFVIGKLGQINASDRITNQVNVVAADTSSRSSGGGTTIINNTGGTIKIEDTGHEISELLFEVLE